MTKRRNQNRRKSTVKCCDHKTRRTKKDLGQVHKPSFVIKFSLARREQRLKYQLLCPSKRQ
jgi:hypothetical protein